MNEREGEYAQYKESENERVGWFEPQDESRHTNRNLFGPAKRKTIFGHGDSWFIDGNAMSAPGRQQGESRSVTALLEAVNLV